MFVYEVVSLYQQEKGMSTAELSRRSKVPYDHLRRSLQGKRRFGAEEALCVFQVLGIPIAELEGKFDLWAESPKEP